MKISESTSVVFGYPIIPWIGLMAVGYVIGVIFIDYHQKDRRYLLIKYGCFSIVLFLMLRYFDIYGEPNSLTKQDSLIFTIMDFLNTTKYPPSLLYILMTIGPSLLVLALIEKIKNRLTDFFIVFGRVPLFYYFLHIFLIHVFAIILLIINDGDPSIMFNMTPFVGQNQQLIEYGYSLWIVYLVWFIVILILYPLCCRYMEYKTSSNKWWLSYL